MSLINILCFLLIIILVLLACYLSYYQKYKIITGGAKFTEELEKLNEIYDNYFKMIETDDKYIQNPLKTQELNKKLLDCRGKFLKLNNTEILELSKLFIFHINSIESYVKTGKTSTMLINNLKIGDINEMIPNLQKAQINITKLKDLQSKLKTYYEQIKKLKNDLIGKIIDNKTININLKLLANTLKTNPNDNSKNKLTDTVKIIYLD